ncbi:hypothetical protein ON010_g6295 [Phytophthora cinnamomi]|nr:hypothetical protein ON010_g6295 [Phytophthora cinnamomi]
MEDESPSLRENCVPVVVRPTEAETSPMRMVSWVELADSTSLSTSMRFGSTSKVCGAWGKGSVGGREATEGEGRAPRAASPWRWRRRRRSSPSSPNNIWHNQANPSGPKMY